MKLTVEFKNYKKIGNLTQEFESSNVYIVQGSNEKAKTSLITGIKTLINGQNDSKNIVSFGKKDGKIVGEFNLEGADNNNYIVKFDFSKDKEVFTLINPDTTITKSNSRNNAIANIFRYNDFTIEEWFGWGLTAEGRRKQANIILNLLSKEDRLKIANIDSEINSKDGILFFKRKKAKKEYEASKAIYKKVELSPAKNEFLKKNADKKKEYDIIKKLYDEAVKESSESKIAIVKRDNLLKESNDIPKQIDEIELQSKDDIDYNDKEIETLLTKVKELQNKNKDIEDNRDKKVKELNDRSNEIDKKIKILNESIPSDAIDTENLEEKINEFETIVSEYNTILLEKEKADEYLKEMQVHHKEALELHEKLEELKEDKQNIFNNANLPIKDIEIDDGEAYYKADGGELIPFTETSVSYSTGGLIVAKLMAHLNKKLPIWCIGKAAEYDKSRMDELTKIAKQYNGIVILDKVCQDEQPLEIVCIDNTK